MQSGRETRCQNGERPRMRTGRGVRGVTPKGWVGWSPWATGCVLAPTINRRGRQCARGVVWCRVSMRWTTVSGLYSSLSIAYRIHTTWPLFLRLSRTASRICLVASLVAVQFNLLLPRVPTHSTPRMCGFLRDASRPPPPSLRRGRLCTFVLTHILA